MRYTEKDRKIFFEQNADALAKGLLGKILCRKLEDNTILRFRIIETEAYPYEDSACYGYKKQAKAVAPLFEVGGTCCIYGGMLLIVCGKKGKADNVLIRKTGNETHYCEGPISVCKELKIDKNFHGADLLSPSSNLWLEDDGVCREYYQTERIRLGKGVKEEDRKRILRFIAI